MEPRTSLEITKRLDATRIDFQHLRIPLKDILSATNNFDQDHEISPFSRVYVGNLSYFKGHGEVAIKRLRMDLEYTQFLQEIILHTRHKHKNIISLLGFCSESSERILVYEYASNRSLDNHLSSTDLTWTQRLNLCLDVARGLEYLHNGKGTKEIIIHRDIRSSNILLDAEWNAKISDFGLSRMVPANRQRSSIVTQVVGTVGYCDPDYVKTGFLTKESDVYAFGVVLFEVLCGKLCYENSNHNILVPKWKKCYKQKQLQEIIFDDLKQQIDHKSLNVFSDIAYNCLRESSVERPSISLVAAELETVLYHREVNAIEDLKRNLLGSAYPLNFDFDRESTKDLKKMLLAAIDSLDSRSESGLTKDYKMRLLAAVNPLDFRSCVLLLLKGTPLNSGKTWFSLNMDGQHCEMISIAECLTSTESESPQYKFSSEYNSRFAVGCYEPFGTTFETHIKTQFLSPNITYTVNLVFKNMFKSRLIGLEFKLRGEMSNSYSFLSDEREDGWLMAELYQFTSDQRTVDLEICFNIEYCPSLLIEGIEFRPLEQVEHAVLMDDGIDSQHVSLPDDYEDIIKRAKDGVQWETKQDAYSVLCMGFLMSYGEEWFYLTKNGKKCLMLPARTALEEDRWYWMSRSGTRFEEVAVADCESDRKFSILCKFSSKMLSPQTTYAAYLVYELPDDYKRVDQPHPVQVLDKDLDSKESNYIFLCTPRTPVVSWNEKEAKTFNPLSRPRIKGLPKLRCDGWMEVQVHEFQTRANIKMISTRLQFSSFKMSLKGVIVQGVEFRPV